MQDDKYMQRCIQLAKKGLGKVAPNPLVGCVIVHQNKIIGEGFHAQYGKAHAEVNAIESVKDKSLLPYSTVYVSLEPCAHFGKTPPCADLLITHKVQKVTIGCIDNNTEVAGKGIQKLKAAGIDVELGILEKECKALNVPFFIFNEKKRPYIILKWAETADGFMAGEQKQISGQYAQQLVHKWRAETPAFLIGTNTLLLDNPQLNSRLFSPKNPIRIAIDFNLKSEGRNLNFYDKSQKTIILNGLKNEQSNAIEYIKIKDTHPQTIVNVLYSLKIQSVIIEGGKALLESFLNENLFDEIRIIKSKIKVFNKGILAPKLEQHTTVVQDLNDDILTIYKSF